MNSVSQGDSELHDFLQQLRKGPRHSEASAKQLNQTIGGLAAVPPDEMPAARPRPSSSQEGEELHKICSLLEVATETHASSHEGQNNKNINHEIQTKTSLEIVSKSPSNQ